ncbi:MAG: chemotaxis protein CheA [Bacteroidales bacterium]|nr:chemotaxis protein CheA [Bacteroidales bacterium]
MDDFRTKFIEEASELIEKMEDALLDLEKSPDDENLIQLVFRVMHTLKGNSSMFGFEQIEKFTHNLETIYDLVRNQQLALSEEIINTTLACVDHLKNMLDESNYEDSDFMTTHNGLMAKILYIANPSEHPMGTDGASPSPTAPQSTPAQPEELATYYILFEPHETIFNNGTNPLYLLDELSELGQIKAFAHLNRMPAFEQLDTDLCYTYWEIFLSTDKDLDAINEVFIFVESDCKLDIQKISDVNILNNNKFIGELEELVRTKSDIGLASAQQLAMRSTSQVKHAKAEVVKKERINTREKNVSSIRVSSEKLDSLMNLVSELVITQARLSLFDNQHDVHGLTPIVESVQKLSRQLRDLAFGIVLIPIENLITRFQRLVRDLSVELKKEVDFIADGTDTELDKTIIDNLADPLMHILRNSLDHGIEEAEVRIAHGKPVKGTIKFKAYYSGASVIIQISDDGAGMNPEAIREKAIQKGIIAPERKLSKKEILDLIFLPGFSTASKVTDISGRGVGMDVVRKKIAAIRGEVDVDSELGRGTTITIKLPLTLSIIDGLLVSINKTSYVIPLAAIKKIYAVDKKLKYGSFNNLKTLDDEQIPFFSLRKEFNLTPSDEQMEQIVVVNFEDSNVGLVVDHVEGEYQAVLKPLGRHYKSHDIFSGATILGNGTVALVMDTNKIIKMFAHLTH